MVKAALARKTMAAILYTILWCFDLFPKPSTHRHNRFGTDYAQNLGLEEARGVEDSAWRQIEYREASIPLGSTKGQAVKAGKTSQAYKRLSGQRQNNADLAWEGWPVVSDMHWRFRLREAFDAVEPLANGSWAFARGPSLGTLEWNCHSASVRWICNASTLNSLE